jgi:putative ABC transport system ATP-binding protein
VFIIAQHVRYKNMVEYPNGKLSPPREVISLQRVSKSYATKAGEFTALKNITLTIHTGEFAAIIGKSGSGKSSLLNIITGIDRATAGEVHVNNTLLTPLSENQLAIWRGRTIGVVFQFFQLLPTLTILENVMLPMDFGNFLTGRERKTRASELLESVGLASQGHKLPSALSGGQQQRVAIARALANDPPILVADEPTGNLDTQTTETIFELFTTLVRQGKTILMVTHERDITAWASQTITLADGEIVLERQREENPHVEPALA